MGAFLTSGACQPAGWSASCEVRQRIARSKASRFEASSEDPKQGQNREWRRISTPSESGRRDSRGCLEKSRARADQRFARRSGQSTRGTVTLRGDFVEQDADGRWIAEIPELRSVLVYGDREARAAHLARALAF